MFEHIRNGALPMRDKLGRFVKGVSGNPSTQFQKGNKINLGKKNGLGHKVSEQHKEIIRLARSGDKNNFWKGDDVQYRQLHAWVNKYLPKPELCQICNKKPPRDLANITGIYNRNFSNWDYLCRSCHKKYDLGGVPFP